MLTLRNSLVAIDSVDHDSMRFLSDLHVPEVVSFSDVAVVPDDVVIDYRRGPVVVDNCRMVYVGDSDRCVIGHPVKISVSDYYGVVDVSVIADIDVDVSDVDTADDNRSRSPAIM